MSTTDMPTDATRMDALERELFRAALVSVLDEVETNLTRTAYSPLVYEYKDYTVALLTPDFELLSQSRWSMPIFLADLGPPVEDAVEQIGLENLASGDVFITNYAGVQGQHLNNIVMGAPIFVDERIVAYVAIRAHWADVGGLVPGSIGWTATEIYHEGVQFRGLKVMQQGRVVGENIATILANTRLEAYVHGDLSAQLGCCLLAQRRWMERIAKRWSLDETDELRRVQRAASAELARRRIGELPDGSYWADCELDGGGPSDGDAPLALRVGIVIDGDTMTVDLTQMPPEVRAPMNSGATGGAASIARLTYKALLAPEYPLDQGLFDPLIIRTRPGSVVSAGPEAPMAHWNAVLPSVGDLMAKALSVALPDRVAAGHHASMSVYTFYGRDAGGKWWQTIDTMGGGWGASVHGDGFSPLKTVFHGDNRNIPSEMLEARFPLRVHAHRFMPGTGGAGLHRGGDGVERVIETTEDVLFIGAMERTKQPPWGIAGGEDGTAGDIEVKPAGEGPWISVRKVSDYPLPRGSIVRVRSHGGGGWGAAEAAGGAPVSGDDDGAVAGA